MRAGRSEPSTGWAITGSVGFGWCTANSAISGFLSGLQTIARPRWQAAPRSAMPSGTTVATPTLDPITRRQVYLRRTVRGLVRAQMALGKLLEQAQAGRSRLRQQVRAQQLRERHRV